MSHNKIGSRTVCLDEEEGKEYTGVMKAVENIRDFLWFNVE